MEHQRTDHNEFSIFVDTDAFIASLKADDPNHERAKDLFERLKQHPIQFMTSNYVFSEAITVLSQRVSKAAALAYIDTMTATESPFQIRRIGEAEEAEALTVFKAQTSKNTSFVDCT